MNEVKLKDISINLDKRRKPLNGLDREKISNKKLYPYCGANNIMDYVDEYLFDEEILCIAEDGGKWGKNETCSYIMNEKCWINNHAHVIKVKENVDIRYLKYWFDYKDLNPFITGAIVRKLTQKALNDLVINLPDKNTQIDISNKIEKIYLLIEKYNEQIKLLDELITSEFINLFGNPIINDKNLPTDKIENIALKEKNSIKAGPFGSSLKKEFYVKDGYKIYGQEQVIADDVNFGDYYIDENKYNELKAYEVKENDILISLVGTYGKILIIPKEYKKGIINPRLMKITPDLEKINPIFFKVLFYLMNTVTDNYTHGGTMGILNVGIIKNMSIILPNIKEQNKFADFVKKVNIQKDIYEDSLIKLEELKDNVMNKYFN